MVFFYTLSICYTKRVFDIQKTPKIILSLNLVLLRKNVFTSTIQCEIKPEILEEF